ncbi:hypothetical protein R3P38DRAFT_3274651 [Favolaschia claudopus]|uniref:BTB domain-containing protein n=1 Tax=Favolaschia claudopus TaxID=2862362 RepID=A0AAW0B0G4_9AGAR
MQSDPSSQSLAQTRTKKRPRTDSFDNEIALALTGLTDIPSISVARDPKYYQVNGDCKIRVGNTLFSIHRSLFEPDFLAFQSMLQLNSASGLTDENPIILARDTAEHFRALCWALYALSNSLTPEQTEGNSIELLTDLAFISHKYQLATIQSWSMNAIRRKCDHDICLWDNEKSYLIHCPDHLLSILLRLFVLYDETALQLLVTNSWITRLTSELPLSAFSTAFEFAEDNKLRTFLGQLYYARLTVADHESRHATFPQVNFPLQELEERHVQRIMRGSWALSNAWQNLLLSLPSLPAHSGCQQHDSKCIPEWKKLWASASTRGSVSDIRSKLRYIRDCLVNASYYGNGRISLGCITAGQSIVVPLIEKVELAFPDYFLGPE